MSSVIEKNLDELVELRHHLHSIAEVSGEEEETAGAVTEYLRAMNPDELITHVGGHGVVARYQGEAEGPAVMLRCELDALPIADENDLSYRSRNPEVGHKCGHDGHMAIMCGVARALKTGRLKRGEVQLLFQPSEETGKGATRVLEDEKFKKLEPDYVFALHNLPGYPLNRILIKKGTFAAASVGFIVRLNGSTSHAAHPEQGRSPAMAMSQLIETLSSIPQFYSSLGQAAKITVIHATLGRRAFGTSPGHAEVLATLRAYDDETLEMLREHAREAAYGLARTYNLDIELEWVEFFPATQNDGDSVDLLQQIADGNELEVSVVEHPFGWSEDFGHFTNNFRGALFGLGAGRQQPSLHAPDYDFPDELIATGITMFLGVVDRLTADESFET